ncbi:VCBS domain-containing protein [Vibrio algivorus]|uniref:Cadherin domain-containing protein n=1 Tax=Vibrio algivorus TaxID=1667024 RepID=A0A557NT38_9VIBR|nr:VCBS domain-containing protein [Vibrio algivorus]TVO31590.1 hypothetical protein FOF44_17915 [Vibrio algivorus]
MEDRKKNKSENKKEQPSKEAIKKLDKNAQRLKAEALRGNADDRIASKTKNDDVADKSWSQAAFVNNLSPNTEVEVEVDTVVSKEQINTTVAGNETNLTQEPQPLVGKIIPTTGEPDVTYSIAENHVSNFGVFRLAPTGAFTFIPSVNSLAGQSQQFTIHATHKGEVHQQQLTITQGHNQIAKVTISGADNAILIEDHNVQAGELHATGNLNIAATAPTDTRVVVETLSGQYGTLEIDANGHWEYSVDNGQQAVQALKSTTTLHESFTIHLVNGDSHQISITIKGDEDKAIISGVDSQPLTEDQHIDTAHHLNAQGKLDIIDVDQGDAYFHAQTSMGKYGEFTIDEQGHWHYSVDDTLQSIQSLASGEKITDTVHVLSKDGATTHDVVVSITGTNDAPVLTVTPNAANLVTGKLTGTDVDTTDTHTFSTTQSIGLYGHLSIDPSTGDYTYTQTPGTVKGMVYNHNTGQYTGHDVFEVQVTDGHGGTDTKYITFDVSATVAGPTVTTPNAPVTIILGAPTPPTITLTTPSTTPLILTAPPTASLTIDLASTSDTYGGTGTNSDDITSVTTPMITGHVDIPFSTVNIFDGTTKVGTVIADDKGDYSVATSVLGGTEAGQLHHLHAEATAPGVAGATPILSPTLDVTIDTGATTVADTGTATEDQTAGVASIGNVLGNDESGMVVKAGDLQGAFGTVHMHADGTYTYDLNNQHPSIQALPDGQTITDIYTYEVMDVAGNTSTETLEITITGTNDNPVVSSAIVDGGHGTDTILRNLPASLVKGQLTATDIDTGDKLSWELMPSSTHSDPHYGDYGHIALAPSGQWVYRVGSAAATALEEGEQVTETFHLKVSDGHGGSTIQTLIIHVTGINNAPIVVTHSQGGLPIAEQTTTQDSSFTFTLPPGTFNDVDHGDHLTLSATGLPSWLHFDATTGTFSGTPTNSDVAGKLPITVTATDTHGAHVEASFALTVNNINDAPVISPISIVTVTEDGAHAAGQLQATDPDVGDAQHLTYSIANAVDGFRLNSDGTWDFDPSDAAYQHIAAGISETVSIPVTVSDGHGGTDTQQLVINITGTNDVPVISGVDSGSVQEESQLTASGTLTISDADAGEDHFIAVSGTTGSGNHGTLDIDASGAWTYHLDNSNAEVQALGESPSGTTNSLTDTFTVTSADGTAHTITVTVNGTNDGPVFTTATLTQSGDEDTSVTGQLGSTDTDTGDSATYAATGTLPAGFTLQADGRYTLDASVQAYQHLEAGHSQDITIPVTVTDGAGGTATQTLTITITGTNDAPTVTHTVVDQTATEDAAFSFALPSDTFNDVDNGDHLTLSATGLPSWLHFDAATSTFSGTPTNADVGKLPITVTATDSHGAQVSTSFALTVNNTNDVPVLSQISTVAVTEDGAHATGQLQATDPDVGDAQHLTYSVANAVDGFTLNSDGTWDFDPSHAAYQHIAAGISETVSIPVTVSDGHGGTDTQQLVINITGTNDNPVVSSTMVDGGHGFDEDTGLTSLSLVRGQLTATDVDTGDALKWEIISTHSAPNIGEYGYIALSPSGQWVYRIGSTDATALSEGEQATEIFHFKVSDGHGGSTTQTLTIHITGVNNAPTVVSHSQGVLPIAEQTTNQDSPFTFTLPADTFIDIDHGDHLTLSVTGLPNWLHFDAATGTFSGTPTNSDVAGKLPITVTATDSHGAHVSTSFALTVNNINDAPVLTPLSTVAVTEDGAHASGQLQATDPDVGDAQHLTYSVVNVVDGFTLNSDGTWDFDPSHAAYQHIAAGVSETVSIPVTVSDGHGGTDTQQLVINITGTNDAPVISGTEHGSITEDQHVTPNATDPSIHELTIQGRLAVTDVDSNEAHFQDQTGVVGDNGFGDFSITPSGFWIYTANNDDPKIQELGANDSHTDSITVTTVDGTSHKIVVTIHGANDAPTLTHTVVSQTATEDTAFSFALPSDTFNDIDNGDHLTLSATGLPSWLHFDAATSTFSGTPSNADVGKLPITVTATDSHGAQVSTSFALTVNNTNDAPTLTHTVVSQTATEDTAFSFALPLDTFKDVDNGDHLTLSATGLPSWLHFDAATSIFSGTPTNADVGKLPITVTATDSHGAHVSTSFALTVNNINDAPVLTPLSTVAVTEDGAHASGQLQATDPDVGDAQHLTYSVANAVDGFTLNNDGTWDFDPSHAAYQHIAAGASETVSIPITVNDGHGGTDTQQLVINITGTNDAPVIAPGGIIENTLLVSSFQQSTLIQGQLVATDIDTNDQPKWEIVNSTGSLNPGASAYGTFIITDDGRWFFRGGGSAGPAGKLAENETVDLPFTVQATDGHGGVVQQVVTVHVVGTNDAPKLTHTVVSQTATEDAAFSFSLPSNTFTDIDHGDHLTLSATGLPNWLHFDAATGTFSGTPTNADVGKLPITVTATDSQGAQVSTSFALTVNNTNDAPTLTITQTTHITGTLVGSDVDVGDVLTYSSPNGVVDSTAHTTVVHGQFGDLTIDTVSGAYTYAPHSSAVGMAFDPATGIYSGHEVFEVVVTDSSGAAMSQFIQFDPTATVTAATTSGNPPVVAAQVQTPPIVTDAMPTLPTITPPTNAVTISLDPASNSGDKTDLITSDTTPTITGHTDIPFSVVEIKDGTTVVATTTSDVNGDYSVTTSALSGSNSGDAHSLTATATAPSAATGVDSSGMVVTVDTGITVPTVDLVDASDSGSNHSDNLTNDTTPTFTLTGIDSDVTQVEVFDGSTSLGMATKVSGSTWTLTTDAAHELTANGHHDITAVVTDTQGNSVTSSPLTISLDTDRPMPPLMFDQITSDNVINAAESTGTVAVTGRVGGVLGQDFVSGDLMTIHLGGKDYQGSVDSSGAFSIDIPGSELAANHAYSASFAAHDNAGNASGVNRLSTSYAVDTDATTASDTDTATEDQAAGVTHGNVLTNDEQGLTVTNAGDKIGTYGTLHLQADGSYTFDLNNLNPAVQAIPTGQTVTDSYTYEVTDAAGNTAQQILTITITGTALLRLGELDIWVKS